MASPLRARTVFGCGALVVAAALVVILTNSVVTVVLATGALLQPLGDATSPDSVEHRSIELAPPPTSRESTALFDITLVQLTDRPGIAPELADLPLRALVSIWHAGGAELVRTQTLELQVGRRVPFPIDELRTLVASRVGQNETVRLQVYKDRTLILDTTVRVPPGRAYVIPAGPRSSRRWLAVRRRAINQ